MLITVEKLNIEFNEDMEYLREKLSELQRLEEAINNSPHYKLLAGKTQMLGKNKGKVRKERSRLVHTNTIANSVVKETIEKIYKRVLKENPLFNDEEYKEIFELNKEIAIVTGKIMAKAHDIGHVAFGHTGEEAINDFFSEIENKEEIKAVLDEHKKYFGEAYEKEQAHIPKVSDNDEKVDRNNLLARINLMRGIGDVRISFEHNELSAILLNQLIEKENIKISEKDVHDLTMGVLGHSTTRTRIDMLDGNLPAQLVRVADKVEYINSDYDELSGLISYNPASIEEKLVDYLKKSKSERLSITTTELANEAFKHGKISEEYETMRRLKRMRNLYKNIIFLYDGKSAYGILQKLLSISDSPEKIQEYYKKNPGTEALYPTETLDMLIKYRELMDSGNVSQSEMEEIYETMLTEQVHFKSVMQGENAERINLIYTKLLNYYYKNQDKMPQGVEKYSITPIDFVSKNSFEYQLNPNYTPLQRTIEYMSLMDDNTLMNKYKELVSERIERGEGFGIEPVTMSEIKSYLRNNFDSKIFQEHQKEKMEGKISRTLYEIRNSLDNESAEYFGKKLSPEGKKYEKEFLADRFKEYDEDFQFYKKMVEADKLRAGDTRNTDKDNELLLI